MFTSSIEYLALPSTNHSAIAQQLRILDIWHHLEFSCYWYKTAKHLLLGHVLKVVKNVEITPITPSFYSATKSASRSLATNHHTLYI